MTPNEIDYLTKAIKISIILVVGLALALLMHLVLRRLESRIENTTKGRERLARLKTLFQAGRSFGHVVIFTVVLLMVLHEMGINIAPVLASAGVVGLAFSLGSQTIIKDYLGGILILSENQFAVGDVLTINTLTGTVERITMRATYLRDGEGKLHLIPNGDIRIVTNLTTQWAQVIITLNVDYEADMGVVLRALDEAAEAIQTDQEIATAILEAPKTFGWTGFTDWAVQVQITVRTNPGMQWAVGRTLRKTVLDCLHKEGVRVALPVQRIDYKDCMETENNQD
jgi:small-conductance mechanosensitive channel